MHRGDSVYESRTRIIVPRPAPAVKGPPRPGAEPTWGLPLIGPRNVYGIGGTSGSGLLYLK